MMVPRYVVPGLLLSVGLFACASPATSGPPAALKMENLLKTALDGEFTPGREVVVSLVEIPPNTTLESHWHPGEEFHYYLDGEAEIRIDGAPPFTGKPGTVGHVPYKVTHTAVTGEKGARALVFRVHTAGEPVRHLAEGGSADR